MFTIWNHVYNFFIGDTIPGFSNYKQDLEENDKMSFYPGFDRYTDMVHLKSETAEIERLQTYLFGKSDTKLLDVLTNGKIPEEDVIYLNISFYLLNFLLRDGIY